MLATFTQAIISTSPTTAERKARAERMPPRVRCIIGSIHIRTRAFVAG